MAFTPKTREELRDALEVYIEDGVSTGRGDPKDWDVSLITNMDTLFEGLSLFNYNISAWDVSKVTSMVAMFEGATSFNQPLNEWNVGAVKNMAVMFEGATSFNQPLNGWNVSNVETMASMFSYATSFNQPLNGWTVTNVNRMDDMFERATSFNQPLSGWDVSKVERMDGMFREASSFNQPLTGWDVTNVKTMASMFSHATSFNQPLNGWTVSNVERMGGMFREASSFNQDLSSWKVGAGVNTARMFSGNTLMSTSDIPSITTNHDENPTHDAYVVHGIFQGIAVDDLLNIIRRGGELSPTRKPFGEYVEDKISDLLALTIATAQPTDEGAAEIETLNRRYEGTIASIRAIDLMRTITPEQLEVAHAALEYVYTQPELFKRIYLKEFLTSCTEAYGTGFNPARPSAGTTCVKGLFERIILTLSSAAAQYIIQTETDSHDEYSRLISAMNPLTRETLNDWAARCREENKAALVDSSYGKEGIQDRVNIYMNCIRGKMITSGIIDETGDNPVKFKKYMKTDIIPLVIDGNDDENAGKIRAYNNRRRKTVNKNKTRVRKTLRQNKKIVMSRRTKPKHKYKRRKTTKNR